MHSLRCFNYALFIQARFNKKWCNTCVYIFISWTLRFTTRGLWWHLCCCGKLRIMNLLKYCIIWVHCLYQGCLMDAIFVFFFNQLMVLYQIIILFFLFKQVSVWTCSLSTEGKPSSSVLIACKSLQQCLFTVLVTPCQNEPCVNTKDHWICRPFQNIRNAHLKRLIYLSISQIQHVPNYHTTRRQALLSTLPVSWVFYTNFNYTVNTKGYMLK